jgi:DNA modification methylase
MQIKLAEISTIKPYENNPRKLSEQAIQKVAMSLKEYGFRQPIVVDKNMVIVAGHTRYRASKKLGLKQVPISVIDNLSEEQINAYRIADNRTAEESEWDNELLKIEIKELEAKDFKLDLLGFNDEQLNDILFEEKQGLTDEDEVPESPEEPISKLGDIWKLGNHRLMCGDSTIIDQIDKLTEKQKPDMIFTDPPYNVAFNGRSGKFDVIKNDNLEESEFNNFIDTIISNLNLLNINTYYICCNWAFYGILEKKLKPKACIVWAKNVFGLGKGYRHQHEFILFDGFIDASIKNESDLWKISKDTKYKHPTQKPVELSSRAIKNSSKPQNTILDIFGGSGSTLIACEKLNRKARIMELDPKYCDVIIKRWENFTGKKAELENGQN